MSPVLVLFQQQSFRTAKYVYQASERRSGFLCNHGWLCVLHNFNGENRSGQGLIALTGGQILSRQETSSRKGLKEVHFWGGIVKNIFTS